MNPESKSPKRQMALYPRNLALALSSDWPDAHRLNCEPAEGGADKRGRQRSLK
jgi:hypothetical protein